jgi:predicted dehydrogenase
MATRRLGIIMNGVTGRMGMNQHLIRSIKAIREQGGVALANGDRVMPDPILIGRNAEKIAALAKAHGVQRWGTDLTTRAGQSRRHGVLRRRHHADAPHAAEPGHRAGKHIYCEKPVATNLAEAMDLYRLAQAQGIKHGVVQDKLFLPGLLKLKMLIDSGFFGRILSVRGEFGYWVFEGDLQPTQRPSWNYRTEDGGGIILDMLCHWRYVLDNLFGEVKSVSCLGATHIPQRWDEQGRRLHRHGRRRGLRHLRAAGPRGRARDRADQQLVGHARAARRPRHLPRRRHARLGRGRAARLPHAGARQHAQAGVEPRREAGAELLRHWQEVPEYTSFDNGFKTQWEAFIRHVVDDAPFRWNLLEGAKGVQLVECALQSWRERRWIDVPALAGLSPRSHA